MSLNIKKFEKIVILSFIYVAGKSAGVRHHVSIVLGEERCVVDTELFAGNHCDVWTPTNTLMRRMCERKEAATNYLATVLLCKFCRE